MTPNRPNNPHFSWTLFPDFGAVCSRRFLWDFYQKIIIQFFCPKYLCSFGHPKKLEDFLKNLYTILNALFYTYFALFLYNILHIYLFIFCYCTICKLFCNSDPGEEYVLILFIHLYYFILFVHKSEMKFMPYLYIVWFQVIGTLGVCYY